MPSRFSDRVRTILSTCARKRIKIERKSKGSLNEALTETARGYEALIGYYVKYGLSILAASYNEETYVRSIQDVRLTF